MSDCIFCKIIAGEILCFKVYEDSDVLAFLDIKPATKGHTLVIPKQHAQDIFDIQGEALERVSIVAKKLSARLKEVLGVDGIRLSQSNGHAAGQEVMHFHLHVIPRYENDGLGHNPIQTLQLPQADFEELKKIAEKLKM